MPRNIEIKARLRNISATEQLLADLNIPRTAVIQQSDIFFACPRGRLKLRRFPDHTGELIFYRRGDQKGPKTSDYVIYRTTDPSGLEAVLAMAYPVMGQVNKTRGLYLAGQTRIHLDRVEGLGTFLELEVVMQAGQDAREGEKTARELMRLLGIGPEDCISGAYIDLLTGYSAAD